jgi:hypothetical protein
VSHAGPATPVSQAWLDVDGWADGAGKTTTISIITRCPGPVGQRIADAISFTPH